MGKKGTCSRCCRERPSYQGHWPPKLATAFCWSQRHTVPDSAGAVKIRLCCSGVSLERGAQAQSVACRGSPLLRAAQRSSFTPESPTDRLVRCLAKRNKGALTLNGLGHSSDLISAAWPLLRRSNGHSPNGWCHFSQVCLRSRTIP
jgi:hypothetical protein